MRDLPTRPPGPACGFCSWYWKGDSDGGKWTLSVHPNCPEHNKGRR